MFLVTGKNWVDVKADNGSTMARLQSGMKGDITSAYIVSETSINVQTTGGSFLFTRVGNNICSWRIDRAYFKN